MTNEERDIQRKLRVLQHAEKIGNARKACRYFGVDPKTVPHDRPSTARQAMLASLRGFFANQSR